VEVRGGEGRFEVNCLIAVSLGSQSTVVKVYCAFHNSCPAVIGDP
jgi:hypothetical protein